MVRVSSRVGSGSLAKNMGWVRVNPFLLRDRSSPKILNRFAMYTNVAKIKYVCIVMCQLTAKNIRELRIANITKL